VQHTYLNIWMEKLEEKEDAKLFVLFQISDTYYRFVSINLSVNCYCHLCHPCCFL